MSIGLATICRRFRPWNFRHLDIRRFASSEEGGPNPEKSESLDLKEADVEQEDYIEKLRDKSGLKTPAYNKIHKKPPPLTEDDKQVSSLIKLRRIYGEHGSASGLDVGLLWPSKEELELLKEWERVAYPDNVHQMIEMAKKQQEEEQHKILKRQEDMALKVAKLEGWKQEVRDRIAKQEKLACEAKEKKERVMEDVRQMFGFRVDPKDEKFKEAVKKIEQEEKKANKAAKKLKKQTKELEEIRRMAEQRDVKTSGDLQGTSIVPGSQPPTKPPKS